MFLKKRINLIILVVILTFSAFYAFRLKNHIIYEGTVGTDQYLNTINIENNNIEQEFTCVENSMDGMSIKLSIKGSSANIKIIYKIIQVKTNEVMASGEVRGRKLKNEKFVDIEFDKMENTLNESYKLDMEIQGQDKENQIGVFYEEISNNYFLLNSKSIDGTIIMKVATRRFDMETFIMAEILLSYIFFVLKALYSLFKA